MFKSLPLKKIVKVIIKIALVFLSLAILCIFIAAATLNTQKGRLWVVALATEYINTNTDFSIQVHKLKFPTLGHLKAEHILVRKNHQLLLELKRFDFNWQPFALIESKIVIHNLTAESILLNKVASSNDSKPSKDPINLAELTIPQIILKRINIQAMTLVGFAPHEYDGIPISISGNARKTDQKTLTGNFQVQTKQKNSTILTLGLSSDDFNQATFEGTLKEPAGGLLSTLLHIPEGLAIDSRFEISATKFSDRLETRVSELSLPLHDHQISLQGSIHFSNDLSNITSEKLILTVDESSHSIKGGIRDRMIDLSLKLNTLPLDLAGIWVSDIDNGWLSSDLHITGLTSAPSATGSLSAKTVYRDTPISADFSGFADRNKISITTLKINVARAIASAKGSLDLVGHKSKIEADLKNFDLEILKPYEKRIPSELTLKVHDAKTVLSGNLKDPSGTLDANASGNYRGKEFTIVTSLKKASNLIHINTLRAAQNQTVAFTNGHIDIRSLESDLEIQANDISTDIIEMVGARLPPELQGSANIKLAVSGPLKDPSAEGESTITGSYKDIPFSINTKGNYSKYRIELTSLHAATYNEQAIQANGFYQNGEFSLHAEVNQLPAKLLSTFGYQVTAGEFNSSIDAHGTVSKPTLNARLQYQSHIEGFSQLGDPEKIPLSWGLNITTKNQHLIVESVVSRNNNSPAQFNLDLPIQPYIDYINHTRSDSTKNAIPLDASFSGSLDLQDFSFLIDPDLHRLNGSFSTELKMTGTLQQPTLDGRINLEHIRYENPITGSLVDKLGCQLNARGSSLEFEKCSATDGGSGTYEVLGSVKLPKATNPGEIKLNLLVKQAHIVRRSDIDNQTTGSISLSGDFNNMEAKGDLEVTPLSASFESSYSSGIPSITVEEVSSLEDNKIEGKQNRSVMPNVDLDISVIAQNQAYLRGRGLEVELEGKIDIDGTLKKPIYNGEFKTVRGTFEVFNKKFDINRGQIYLTNNAVSIAILGIFKKNGQSIQVDLSGTNEKLDINFSAIPAMPEDEILAFLIFGKSIHNMTAFEAIQLASSIQSLRGGGGFDPVASTRKMLGVDTLSVESATTDNGETGVNVGVGKYLSDKVYLELQRTPDPSQPWKGNLEIELSPTIHLNSSTGGSTGLQDAEITWEKDY